MKQASLALISPRIAARVLRSIADAELPKDERTRLAMREARELAQRDDVGDVELSELVGRLAFSRGLEMEEGIELAAYARTWRERYQAQQ